MRVRSLEQNEIASPPVYKIYVVFGEAGMYSDWELWPVKYFTSEEDAKQYVEMCSLSVRMIEQHLDKYAFEWWQVGCFEEATECLKECPYFDKLVDWDTVHTIYDNNRKYGDLRDTKYHYKEIEKGLLQ